MSAPELEIENLTLRYGGLTAIDALSLRIETGGLHALIGPNGAGKTSVFNAISGLARGQSGAISLRGERIERLSPDARARRGLARTFQNLRLFNEMTALENVLAGMHAEMGGTLLDVLTRLGGFHAKERAAVSAARELLDFVGLAAVARTLARALSYGDQRRLEIARALAAKPKTAAARRARRRHESGRDPRALNQLLGASGARGVTMLLVEHDMGLVMRLCDRSRC